MPAYQGEFDGLCGMYAIANAYEICGYGDISKLFKVACDALAPRRWPAVLWDGTSFGDMKKMISVCQTEIEDQYDEPITVNYPFSRNPPKSNEIYWEKFDDIFQNENAYCAIVSLTKPSPHWIVYPVTRGEGYGLPTQVAMIVNTEKTLRHFMQARGDAGRPNGCWTVAN